MSGRPDTWMPMYWRDYIADTRNLSTEQHGAYLLLIGYYWVTGRPLPDDDAQLCAVARCTLARWRALRPLVLAFFRREHDGWRHKRIDHELAKTTGAYERRTKANRENIRKRYQKPTNGSPVVDAPSYQPNTQLQPQPQSEANASEVEAAPPAPPAPPKRKTRLPEDFHVPPDWLAWAIEDHGMLAGQVYEQAKRFTDHWRGTGEPKADWQATWRNWIRRAEDFDGKRPAGKGDRMLAGFAAAFSDGTG